MLPAVNTLEVEFKKVSADLQFTVHRLEAEFSGASSKSSSVRSDTNPLKLHRRIAQLQSNFAPLAKRCIEASSKKADLVSQLRQYCAEIQSNLAEITTRALPGTDDESALCLSAFEQIADSIPGCAAGVVVRPVGVVGGAGAAVEASTDLPAPLKPKAMNAQAAASAAPTSSSFSCSDVDLAEFEAVPSSIRGRCKYEDVVKALSVIVSYYAEEAAPAGSKPGRGAKKVWNAPKPVLTVAASEKLGAKVSGLTGKTTLNVLRHLGKIQLSSDGITLPVTIKKRRM